MPTLTEKAAKQPEKPAKPRECFGGNQKFFFFPQDFSHGTVERTERGFRVPCPVCKQLIGLKLLTPSVSVIELTGYGSGVFAYHKR